MQIIRTYCIRLVQWVANVKRCSCGKEDNYRMHKKCYIETIFRIRVKR